MESRERIFSPVPTAHKLLLPERFSKRWELTGLTFSFEKHDSSNTFSTKAIFVVLQKKKKRERQNISGPGVRGPEPYIFSFCCQVTNNSSFYEVAFKKNLFCVLSIQSSTIKNITSKQVSFSLEFPTRYESVKKLNFRVISHDSTLEEIVLEFKRTVSEVADNLYLQS